MQKHNKVEELFWGRIKVEQATSFYYFNKGSEFQNIIHKLKYRNLKEIGFELGKHFGTDLLESGYNSGDVIIPIPLHTQKQQKRGYNQSEWIALGLSASLKIPVKTGIIVRERHTDTQTHKSRFERWQNVRDIFTVIKPTSLQSKHVILVDDVITTGATMEACAQKILEISGTKISLASLALA